MKKLLLTITALTLLMPVSVLLNIPVLREITVFIYLTFIPGFLLFRILKLGDTNLTDAILFSVGLSWIFLMLIGLLVNESYPFGVSQPLSAVPLTLGVSISTVILLFVCYKRNLLDGFVSFKANLKVTNVLFFRCAILVLPPVLGLVGALFLSIPLLLFLIALIAVLFALSVLSNKLIPSELYPLLIFSVSLALLFHVVFTSKYIMGFDANLEYYVFKSTQISGNWGFINPIVNTIPTVDYNAMLSITILPTIYASMTNLSGEIIFKLLYQFALALVPVALYRVFERQINRLASLLSVLFFISGYLVFYGLTPISINRQIVATLFLVLSVFILLSKNMPLGKRRILLIIFGTAIAFSHYSLMYIYLAFVFFIYVVSALRGRKDEALNSTVVMFLLVIAISWYYFSVAPLTQVSQFIIGFVSRFSADLLSPAARSTMTFVSQPVSNLITTFSLGAFFIANFLVVLGILVTVFKPKYAGFDSTFRMVAILGAFLMFLSFALPNFAPSLNIERFYEISLLFVAPCFIVGFNVILGVTRRVWQKISGQRFSRKRFEQIGTAVLCIVLVSFFLTQTGFVNRITGNTPLLRSLDLDRLKTANDTRLEISYYNAYLQDSEVFGAVWLHEHAPANSIVFADYIATQNVMASYALVPLHLVYPLTNTTVLSQRSFIYLGKLSVVNNIIYTDNGPINSSEVWPLLSQADIIYSNGKTEVMYVP